MDRVGVNPMAIELHAVVCSSTCTVSLTHTRDCLFTVGSCWCVAFERVLFRKLLGPMAETCARDS